jgi:DNA-binding GntR family transcriptional regulator
MVQTRAPKSYESLRTVLSDKTYSRIRDMLLTHEIAPGHRVNIDALARELDVSQTPVREALARLEADDLVTKKPLRGYHATNLLTVSQIQDLFQFRELIEPWAAMKAAHSIDGEGRRRIRQELLKGKSAEKLDIDEAYSAMSEHDARFHTLIAELSGSEFVRDAYVRTHCHLHMFRLYTVLKTWLEEHRADAAVVGYLFDLYYNPTSGFLALREHEEIANAVLSGDGDNAAVLMLQHIDNSLSRFGPSLSVIEKTFSSGQQSK